MADPVRLSVETVLVGLGPFAAGGMLLWGLVALVPIVLHLLRRRRFRTVHWGAMQFLRAAVARRAKQFQLWRLLLLLLRVAAVLAIAAALARPLLPGVERGQAAGEAPPTLRVLVMDVSYSMRTVAGSQSRWAAAQQAAAEICRQARSGDGFLLMAMGDPPEAIIEQVSQRADQCIAEIQRLAPSDGRADLPTTLAEVHAAVDDAVRSGWPGPIDVIVFSDLQQSTWETLSESGSQGGDGPAEHPVRYLLWDAAEGPASDNGPISDPATANATVVRLERDRSGDADDRTLGFLSTIAHTASTGGAGQGISSRLAQLVIDENVEQSQRFDVQPGQSQTLLWSAPLAPGRHAVEVRIGDDALATDNTRRLLVELTPRIPVAAFGPTPADTRYLALAASPGGRGSIEIQSFGIDQLPRTEIGRFAVWVLCNPPPLGQQAMGRIAEHVEQGGGVVWWLGPRWQSGRGVSVTASDASGAAQQQTAQQQTARQTWRAVEATSAEAGEIDPLDYRSDIVRPFEAFPGAGLLSLPVFRYWTLELGSDWEPAVAILDGDPLIASLDTAGAGRQVIIATPPGPGRSGDAAEADPWNALIAWPSFVPLVQEILHWAQAGGIGPTSFLVGQPVAGQTPESEMGEALVSDSGARLDVQVQSRRGQSVRWSGGVANSAGFYYWSDGDEASSGPPAIAVNVDPAEGRLEKITALAEPWILYDAATAEPEEVDAPAARELPLGASSGREVFWWLLLAALGLLTAESLVVRFLEGRF